MRHPRNDQRGIALLTALLVVALATLLVAMLLDRAESGIARTRNLTRGAQGDQYAAGLEAWAIDLLRRDAAEDSSVDSRDDIWGSPLPPTPVPGGSVRGAMRDLNGCFDLTRLIDQAGVEVPRETARLRRLLAALKLNPDLSDAVVDWLDADFETRPRGGEDNLYLQAAPGYRAANRHMVHVSELRLVRGFDSTTYATVAPHVCALPDRSPLNVNTATVPVLMSLGATITQGMAERMAQDGHAHYRQASDFTSELLRQGGLIDSTLIPGRDYGVASEYFVAEAELKLDDIPFAYSSVIERRGGRFAVVARMRGSW
jgi:general secretion pathway protein K